MSDRSRRSLAAQLLPILAFSSGLAALSWEVIWQLQTGLALGISALGASLTLAVTMGGMGTGALWSSHTLKAHFAANPQRVYGVLEIVIGLCGLALLPLFGLLTSVDTWFYQSMPAQMPLVYLLGSIFVIGLPAFCMGATFPMLGLLSRIIDVPLARLYGLNTLGAAFGALLVAFCLIPLFGIQGTCWLVGLTNIAVGLLAYKLLLPSATALAADIHINATASSQLGMRQSIGLVTVTGFVTLLLEVAWFRALTAAFLSTTDAFALMLSVVLVALGLAAWLVPVLRHLNMTLSAAVVASGLLILVATPIIERFYLLTPAYNSPAFVLIDRFIKTFMVIGIPVVFLGMALPWVLDERKNSREWGVLYGANTFAAILGATTAAWLLLPTIGFARSAWLAGGLILTYGFWLLPRQRRLAAAAAAIAAIGVAVFCEAGIGRNLVAGRIGFEGNVPSKVLEYYEGPESNVSAVAYDNGARALIVDGFVTAAQQLDKNIGSSVSYMAWMGHLPMLLHPNPQNALVICFGTGQTANAVRRQNPVSLDIVDINPRVFKLAHNFYQNEKVLEDPRVHQIVMDGRAYMRRTAKTYDVITLEPMPPNFAGVNALYSLEFYRLAKSRLNVGGIIAQWVPFHVAAAPYMAAIVKTFQSEFPNTVLWLDPTSKTGILLGRNDDAGNLGHAWPGLLRNPSLSASLPLSPQQIISALTLDATGVSRYVSGTSLISDDNQLLAYGRAVNGIYQGDAYNRETFALIEAAKLGAQ
ncbi:MAG: fused MFS/spermidine synthase [Alphaproteobacteria bacterium]|nr:fused MFS/spermidine synthase [Alphaproteobacteria bacterium]